MTLKPHTVFENDGIDLRVIKCICDNPQCKIGISFDTDNSIVPHQLLFRMHDKYGNEHHLKMNQETIKELIEQLKKEL